MCATPSSPAAGGVSKGVYRSLNVGQGSRDDPNAVAENRARAAAVFEIESPRLLTCFQVHSSIAVAADHPWGERPEADAVVTAAHGLACGALAADCAPVLIADAEAGVVGAAHAGWRGALGGGGPGRRRRDGQARRGAVPHGRRSRPLHRAGLL